MGAGGGLAVMLVSGPWGIGDGPTVDGGVDALGVDGLGLLAAPGSEALSTSLADPSLTFVDLLLPDESWSSEFG